MTNKLRVLQWYMRTKYFRRFRDERALMEWQERQLKRHLCFVNDNSLFYSYYLQLPPTNGYSAKELLASLTPIDKRVMMDHFDTLNTVGIQKEEAFKMALSSEETRDFSPRIGTMTIGMSSGTSGNRGLFLVSDDERSQWAGIILAKLLPHGLLAKERIAFFLRANSNLYESVQSGTIEFHFYDLLHSLQQHVDNLQRLQPTILIAPPSMLRMLAVQQADSKLTIAPRKVISVAEVLDPLDEEFIGRHFRQTVHQVYQCTEGLLGATCEHGTLHLNEDLLYIKREYVTADRKKFMPIVTDMFRSSQPIINYRLNDILTLREEPCPCGSPLTAISQIEGRSDDIFEFLSTSGEEKVSIFPDFIRQSIYSSSDRIDEYKVLQHPSRELEVQIQVHWDTPIQEDAITASLTRTIRSHGGVVPNIYFTPYEPHQGITKLKRIERL